MKIQIKARSAGPVLFEHDADGNTLKATLEAAVAARADLSGANLYGANLSGANLYGAKIAEDTKLIGPRPVLQIGPIGSRSATLVAYLTNRGVFLQTGCFFGTADEFVASLAKTHGGNDHAAEYTAALVLIQKHAGLWSHK